MEIPAQNATTASRPTSLIPRAKQTVVGPCSLGVHLRVAAQVVRWAKQFESEIHGRYGRRRVDAKSIFGMLSLGAVRGQQLSLVARGPDAARAVQELAMLFQSKEMLCKESEASAGGSHDTRSA